jgi:hypothetical protein
MLCRTTSLDSTSDSTSVTSSSPTIIFNDNFQDFIEKKNIALSTLANLEFDEWEIDSYGTSSYERYNSNIIIVTSRSDDTSFEDKIQKNVNVMQRTIIQV